MGKPLRIEVLAFQQQEPHRRGGVHHRRHREAHARAEAGDHQATDARPHNARRTVDGAVESNAIGDQLRLDQLADNRRACRKIHGAGDAQNCGQHQDLPVLHRMREHQAGHDGRFGADHQLHDHEKSARLAAVDQDAREQRQNGHG